MAERAQPALLCFDGTPAAGHAIETAAALLGHGHWAIVLHVWESVVAAAAPGFPVEPYSATMQASVVELDAVAARRATEIAVAGAEAARAAGFAAEPQAEETDGRTWETILRVADDHDAGVIVMGKRERSGLQTVLLGSVSNGVVHHSERPVLIVPSSDAPGAGPQGAGAR